MPKLSSDTEVEAALACEPQDQISPELAEYLAQDDLRNLSDDEARVVGELFVSREHFERLFNEESARVSQMAKDAAELRKELLATSAQCTSAIEQYTVNFAAIEKAMGERTLALDASEAANEELQRANALLMEQLDVARLETAAMADMRKEAVETAEKFSELSRENHRKHVEALKENDALRDRLMTACLDAERLRGYLDAVKDGEPPRMVPEDRQRRSNLPGYEIDVGNGSRSAPWYRRG